jgi:DNA-binding response OmpR family regulator
MNILVIEDDPKVVAFIKEGLEEEQHKTTVVYDGHFG